MPDEDREKERAHYVELGREMGRVQERVDNVRQGLTAHIEATENRFYRLEDRITEGFRQGQQDREAGNKTLGDMIAGVSADVKTMAQTMNRGQGALTLSDKMLGVAAMIACAALGGWISHL